MHDASELVGVWSDCAHPLQETIVVLCPDGQGLFYFYWGSCAHTPYVDEFEWQFDDARKFKVKWRILHEYDYDEDEEEEPAAGYHCFVFADSRPPDIGFFDAPEDRMIVTSGKEEFIPLEFYAIGKGQRKLGMSFDRSIGLNDYFTYCRKPQSFDIEKQNLTAQTSTFDPFGPDRNVWLIGADNTWRRAIEERSAAEWGQRDSGFLPLGIPNEALGLIFGTLAQVAFFADVGRDSIPVWLRIGVHALPIALVVFFSDAEEFGNWSAKLLRLGATCHLLLAFAVVVAAQAGWRPEGWIFYMALNGIGALCAALLLKKTSAA